MSRPPCSAPVTALAAVLVSLTATLLVTAPADAGPWRPPVPLGADSNILVGSEQIATNARGDSVVVYLSYVGPNPVVHVVRRPAGGTWSAPAVVSTTGVNANEPDVDVAADGRALVTWVADTGTNLRLYARTVPVSGALGAIRAVTSTAAGDNAFYPDVAVTSAGRAAVVWSTGEVAAAVVGTVTELGDPQALSDPADNVVAPAVALTPAGEATFVWEGVFSSPQLTTLVSSCRWPLAAATCDEPVLLSAPTPGLRDENPAVAVNAAGEAIACLGRSYGGNPTRTLYLVRDPDGTWHGPSRVAPDLVTAPEYCAVAQRRDGSAAVAFADTEGNLYLATRESGGFDVRRQLNAPGFESAVVDLAQGPADHVAAVLTKGDVVRAALLAPTGRSAGRESDILVDSVPSSSWVTADLDDQGNVYVFALTLDAGSTRVTTTMYDAAPPSVTRIALPTSARRGRTVLIRAVGITDRVSPVKATWRFSDGTTATGPSPSKRLTRVGRLGITLTLTDAAGRRTVRTASLIVSS